MKGKIDYVEEDGLTYEVRIYSSGNKYWHYNGKLHRLNGPAVELANSNRKDYFINDEYFKTFEEYKEAAIQYKIDEILNS